MDTSRLSRSEYMAVAGAVLLVIALFLPWYQPTPGNVAANIDGAARDLQRLGRASRSCAGSCCCSRLRRSSSPRSSSAATRCPWPRGEMTAVVAIAGLRPAALLRLRRQARRPGERDLAEVRLLRWRCSAILLILIGSASAHGRDERRAQATRNLLSMEPMTPPATPRSGRTATSRSSSCASPRPPRWPPRAWSAWATRRPPTRPRSTRMRARPRHRPHGRHGRHRRGREGRGADALQRRAHRRRQRRREVDIAVDPLEGTTLARQGHAQRAGGDRAVRARHDVRPRARRLHGEAGRRPRTSPTCSTSTARWARRCAGRRAPRRGHRRRDGRRPRPPAPRGGHRGDPRRRRARAAHPRRRRQRRAAGGQRPLARDLLWGIGGTPEGVISAAAIKCIGGGLVGRLWPRDDDERKAALDAGLRPRAPAHRRTTWSRGDDCFFAATGVTDGDVLQGVRYFGARRATTESLVMRSRTGTVRRI